MNIVIIGAGSIGLHCAEMLSKDHNVIIVDTDEQRLKLAARDVDVATKKGEGHDWQLLEELMEIHPHVLLALTDEDEVNLVACSIAKNLGYATTVARASKVRYLNCSRVDFGRIFHADSIIAPDVLTAEDIFEVIIQPASLACESFAHGSVLMRTFAVPHTWRKSGQALRDLKLPEGMMVGFLCRRDASGSMKHRQHIFPHGDDFIIPGDEVTVIGKRDAVVNAHQFFGISQKPFSSAVIVGGTRIAIHLAKMLEQVGISVRIIEKDYDRCCTLSEKLPYTTILHHDATDLGFLNSEKVGKADVFIACTYRDELNLLGALLAKEAGCSNIITTISDTRYVPIVKSLNVMHVFSPRVSTVNRILSIIQQDKVSSMISMYDDNAEILEIKVSPESRLAGIPISELGPQLPSDFLLSVIQNRGRIMVANGDHILSPGDTVIAITNPKHMNKLRELF
jgi:trk system potassium uptake protein